MMNRLRTQETAKQTSQAAETRTEIIRAFEKYLRFMTNSYAKRSVGYRFNCHHREELYSASKEALLIAMRNWDSKRDIPLANLASRWISGACKNVNAFTPDQPFATQNHPRSIIRKFRAIEEAENQKAAIKYLDSCHVTITTKRSIILLAHEVDKVPLKLQDSLSQSSTETLENRIVDVSNTQPSSTDITEILNALVKNLVDRRMAIILYFRYPETINRDSVGNVPNRSGENIKVPTPDQIADRITLRYLASFLELSNERVRQLEQESLLLLYGSIRNKLTLHDWRTLRADRF